MSPATRSGKLKANSRARIPPRDQPKIKQRSILACLVVLLNQLNELTYQNYADSDFFRIHANLELWFDSAQINDSVKTARLLPEPG